MSQYISVVVNIELQVSNINYDELLTKTKANDQLLSAEGKKMDLSKIVTTWIELQNSVNCYMDSSKDINQLQKKVDTGWIHLQF